MDSVVDKELPFDVGGILNMSLTCPQHGLLYSCLTCASIALEDLKVLHDAVKNRRIGKLELERS